MINQDKDKDFVPYQPSVDMKELGFDEPCVYYVDKDNESYIYNFETHPDEFIEWCGVNVIPTPTFSQAFRWFREKYKLQTYIDFYHSESYFFKIKSQDGRHIGNIGDIILQGSPLFTRTYEEAELACLKKLIQIVKKK
jgi:hypothetical protein